MDRPVLALTRSDYAGKAPNDSAHAFDSRAFSDAQIRLWLDLRRFWFARLQSARSINASTKAQARIAHCEDFLVRIETHHLAILERKLASTLKAKSLAPAILDAPRLSQSREAPLHGAQRHVLEGEQHIVRQRERIAKLRADGRDATAGEDLLVCFERLLTLMRDNLAHQEQQAGRRDADENAS